MNQPKRRRVYEVVERREYPYFEPGDKVKMNPNHRSIQPVVEDGKVRWAGSGAALAHFTVEKYVGATYVKDWAGVIFKELPETPFDVDSLMPADWTDEEWEASEANPLIVNRPIAPKMMIIPDRTPASFYFEKLVAEMAALLQQETEFFTRLKEREAELENIARTQIASQSDKG
jgi:hypothetical protein